MNRTYESKELGKKQMNERMEAKNPGKIGDLGIEALVFDVASLIDWHGAVCDELTRFGKNRGLERNWAEVTNAWTWRAVRKVQQQKPPTMNMDGYYRTTLDDILDEFKIAGVTDAEKSELARAPHKMAAWPDSAAGHARLRQKFIVASFPAHTLALLISVSRRVPFHWDCIIACEMLGCYKPDPLSYRRVAELLALRPDQLLMVAAHNNDLLAAKSEGFRTAFIARPLEQGAGLTPTPTPDPLIDIVANDIVDLASQLGA